MAKDLEKTDALQPGTESESQQLLIGCTIGSDSKDHQIRRIHQAGARSFQIMVDFNRRGELKDSPSIIRRKIPKDSSIILHMPFYFHLLLERNTIRRKMIVEINKKWGKIEKGINLIIHCKGIHLKAIRTMQKISEFLKYYAALSPDLTLCLENDAGGKDNPAPSLRSLIKVIKKLRGQGIDNIGLCLDTQHAYAAGDDIFSIEIDSDVKIIHLNAIPKYVKFGGHLDRHSVCPLYAGKGGTSLVRKILRNTNPEIPLILERTEDSIIIKDINLLKEMTYA